MALRGKKIIECTANSDVKSLVVGGGNPDGLVLLNVNDEDSDDSSDGAPLIVALLLPSQAVKLARALLHAAGATGSRDLNTNVTRYTFID